MVVDTNILIACFNGEEAAIKIFLQDFIFIPTNEDLSEKAASIQRMYGLALPDATIAATAWAYHVPLATRDKQFKKVKEISVIVP